MDHFEIVEKLHEQTWDIIHDTRSSSYMISAAIYDTWSVGTELEKNLASRLVQSWSDVLECDMNEAFKDTRYWADRPRPARSTYCADWVEKSRKVYTDHKGLLAALALIKLPEGYF